MKIAVGADHLGCSLRAVILACLQEVGIPFEYFGALDGEQTTDYPDIGELVALAIQRGDFDRGILICGTGIDMAIVANKVPGVRAAVVHDPYSAERARKSNDAQVMAMGSLIVGPQLARSLTKVWLASEFQGGDSARKLGKIVALERAAHSDGKIREHS